MEHDPLNAIKGPQRISRVVASVFGLIGLTVCISLWFAPFGAFGSPPLFFRMFGSFIGLIFMIVGFGGAISAGGAHRWQRLRGRQGMQRDVERNVGYTCHRCGSGLQSGADVSPSGDVKCSFCNRWFNIHRAG